MPEGERRKCNAEEQSIAAIARQAENNKDLTVGKEQPLPLMGNIQSTERTWKAEPVEAVSRI